MTFLLIDELNQNFLTIWLIGVVFMVSLFLILGKKSLAKFPNIDSVNVKFREQFTSGYSNDSFITRMGGASGVLDVVVTDKELWTKTFWFFGWIARIYKLLHKIDFNQIISVNRVDKRKVVITFRDDKESIRSITLKLKDIDGFLISIPNQNLITSAYKR